MWTALHDTGRWDGEVWNRRKNGEVYPAWLAISAVRDEHGGLTHYIGIFSDITERKTADERIHYLAHYDFLTGLPNRALLSTHLDHAIALAKRNARCLAVLFLDLDRFKHVNDSLGHYTGDLLLQAVSKRLTEALRESDTVARLGGDEFIIVLADLSAGQDAVVVAEHILEILSKPFDIAGHELGITPSIGISIYPHDGADIESLIKNADAAMYHAKALGRNNYQFYTQDMNARALEALSLEGELRRALKRWEFVLFYQISLGKSLGLRVIAEGVETLEQFELLRAQGCDEVQGYYAGRLVSANEFTQILKHYSALTGHGKLRRPRS